MREEPLSILNETHYFTDELTEKTPYSFLCLFTETVIGSCTQLPNTGDYIRNYFKPDKTRTPDVATLFMLTSPHAAHIQCS